MVKMGMKKLVGQLLIPKKLSEMVQKNFRAHKRSKGSWGKVIGQVRNYEKVVGKWSKKYKTKTYGKFVRRPRKDSTNWKSRNLSGY